MKTFPYSGEEIKKNIKSIIRDINISILNDDLELNITPNIRSIKKGKNWIFNKPYWKIIEKHKHNCIITGSMALKAFGLIDREPNDVDLILMDKNDPIVKRLHKDRYGWEPDNETMYGYLNLNPYVDFFIYNESIHYIEYKGYKFQHPLEIIKTKAEMARNEKHLTTKDYFDIIKSIENINI